MKTKPTIDDIGRGFLILVLMILMFAALQCLCGCTSYRGGKVIDGTNLAIGMKLPGTDWDFNILDYVGGIRVAGNDATIITVSNEVFETNSYFGIVTTERHSKMTAAIEPTEVGTESPTPNP